MLPLVTVRITIGALSKRENVDDSKSKFLQAMNESKDYYVLSIARSLTQFEVFIKRFL